MIGCNYWCWWVVLAHRIRLSSSDHCLECCLMRKERGSYLVIGKEFCSVNALKAESYDLHKAQIPSKFE